MLIIGQVDPTREISTILSYPVETLLAGVLLVFAITALIIARQFGRWVGNMDRMFARREEMDSKLLSLIDATEKTLNESAKSASRTAAATEVTAARFIQLDATMSRWQAIQTRNVLPALKSIYGRLIRVENKLDRCNTDELHRELVGLRKDLSAAAWLVVHNASTEDITPFAPVEEKQNDP